MRLALVAGLLTLGLGAQDFRRPIQVKPLVPRLDQPWRQLIPAGGVTVEEYTGRQPASGACSIPLTTVRPPSSGSGVVLIPPAEGFAVRTVTLPAPPCTPAKP